MNFLELCQRAKEDAAIQGDTLASTVNQSGIIPKLVSWVREAYLDIQNMPHRFNWMRQVVILPITSGVYDYSLDLAPWSRPDIREFEKGHVRLISASGQFQACAVLEFDEFDMRYPLIQNVGQPSALTVTPDRAVVFNSIPNSALNMRGVVRLKPQILTNDTDIPNMPEEHHLLIVHKAVMRYARHDGDRELLVDAKLDVDTATRALIQRTVPIIRFEAVPLIDGGSSGWGGFSGGAMPAPPAPSPALSPSPSPAPAPSTYWSPGYGPADYVL